MWLLKSLVAIPGFIIGAMIGFVFLAVLPTLVFVLFWYGPEAYQHPDAIDCLIRPAIAIGGLCGAIIAIAIIFGGGD